MRGTDRQRQQAFDKLDTDMQRFLLDFREAFGAKPAAVRLSLNGEVVFDSIGQSPPGRQIVPHVPTKTMPWNAARSEPEACR